MAAAGNAALTVTSVLRKPWHVLEARKGVPVLELETMECLRRLEDGGWSVVMHQRGVKHKPYVVGGAKHFYIKETIDGFTRGYFQALLLAGTHGRPVPPFKSHPWYLALISGTEYVPAPRGTQFDFGKEESAPRPPKRAKTNRSESD